MKIIVTGGCGFIGSHIVDAYINQGHQVFVVDKKNHLDINFENKKAKYFQLNLTDKKSLNSLVKSISPNIINHHAANISLKKSVEQPLYDANNNISAMINLLEAAKNNQVNKIVYASSAGALYSQKETLPFTEKTIPQPITPYGVSKLACEHYLKVYSHLYGINFVILRYSNVYGPRQNTTMKPVIATFIKQIVDHKTPTVFNQGKQTRDFVYVEDLKVANLLALDYQGNEIFNISSNKEVSIFQAFTRIEKILNSKNEPRFAENTVKEQQRSKVANQKAQKILNWKPKTNFQTGIKKTIDWFQNNNM